MAKNEEKVMEFVKKELEDNPEVTTSDLYERAKKVDSGVSKLSLRQFNARFPLQIKRKKSLNETGGRRRRRRKAARTRGRQATATQRDAVRGAFLRFAAELSAAEERKELVGVIAQVDQYVDEVMSAVGAKKR